MHRSAIGIRVHSGWGALIALTHQNNAIQILDRRRIPITGTTDPGASQPYHAVRNLQPPKPNPSWQTPSPPHTPPPHPPFVKLLTSCAPKSTKSPAAPS